MFPDVSGSRICKQGDNMIFHNPDYENPIGTIRDPMIVPYGGRYYLVGTSPEFWRGPNPGVRMWSSDDLKNWEFEGRVINSDEIPDGATFKNRFWAPELFIHGSRFYITFNAMNESEAQEADFYRGLRSFVAVSDSITGPYVINEKPLIERDGVTNDAHLFADDDGSVWLFFNTESAIFTRRFDTETASTYGDIIPVIEKGKSGEWDSIGIEGSFVVRRNGKLYLWYSSWTRGYEMGIAESDGIGKPFVKRKDNPIVSSGTKPPIKYCGHNSCFKLADGRDAIAYHGHDDGKPESLCIEIIKYPPEPHSPATEIVL